MSGKIILILSCMFSGKTEMLISFARRYMISKKRICIVKYSKDTRYSNMDVCSHNLTNIESTFSCNRLGDIESSSKVQDSDVILIDEGQFFPDIAEFSDKYACLGKTIVIAALNSTYQRKPFPVIADLIAISEEIINLKAVCSICTGDAYFTKRITDNNDLEVIGGIESYQPRCRKCFEK